MNVYFRWCFFLLSCVICALGAQQSVAQSAAKGEKPLEVIVQTVVKRNIQNNIEALGTLKANESTALTAKVAKTVTRVHFTDGQYVDKGAVIVEMTNSEEAALMDEARLTAAEAKKQLERNQLLAKQGAVSASLLDQLTRQYTTAQARYLATQSRFNELVITAPFAGVLGMRNLSVGALIAPGQLITTLIDDSKMKLDFSIPAAYLRYLKVGLPVQANSQDLGNKIFNGEIVSVDNQIDEATRSVKVRALINNPQHELKQGLLLSVTVLAESRSSLLMREAALVPMGSNNFVFALVPAANHISSPASQPTNAKLAATWKAEKRQVAIGQRNQGWVEVLTGLSENDKVVTHGLQKIRAGQTVGIMAEETNDPSQPPQTLSDLLSQKNSGANSP